MKWMEIIKKIRLNNTLIVIVLILLGWITLREMKLDRQGKKMSQLDSLYYVVNSEREVFKERAYQLAKEYADLEMQLQAAESTLQKKNDELFWLKEKHQKEIDSLLKVDVPVDTLYIRTGLLYPNLDGGNLEYPYSGSQVKQIYTTGVYYPRIRSEYELQGSLLNSCFAVNASHVLTEQNLTSQLGNCKADVMAANNQIGIRTQEVVYLKKKIKQKSFWNIVLEITTFSGWVYAAFK